MELSELIRTKRQMPERTWNLASSAHWYDGDDFWLEMITSNKTYRSAMIETEAMLIDKLCDEMRGKQQEGVFVALGPGDGSKELKLRAALGTPTYIPIDINENELSLATTVPGARPIRAEFREGLEMVKDERPKFIYLGSTYSNLDAIHYDLLAAIDESMTAGDRMYLSVQALPDVAHLPLLLHQYKNDQYNRLNRRMAGAIGAETEDIFVQFNPLTRNLEIGSAVSCAKGTAKEIGMRPGDKIITMVSYKPASLLPELDARFGTRYGIDIYRVRHEVPTPSGTYTSTFEGAVLTKR